MELLEAYKLYPHTAYEVRIYEFYGRNKKLTDQTNKQGQTHRLIHRGNPYSLCVAAQNLYQALSYLNEVRPEFQPNYAHYCGVLFLQHRCFEKQEWKAPG